MNSTNAIRRREKPLQYKARATSSLALILYQMPECVFLESVEVWMPDGTIVIAVARRRRPERTGPQVVELFKVNRHTLAQHSPSLCAMIDKKLGGSAEKDYSGMPLARLPYDAEDLKVFLQLLFGLRVEVRLLAPGTETHSLLAGSLRLSIKHRADNVRTRIVRYLRRDWPITLPTWDAHDGILRSSPGPDPVTMVRLATECNVPAILPAAFYHFSRLQSRSQQNDPAAVKVLKTSAAQVEDFQMLLIGRERLRSHLARWALSLDEDLARGASPVGDHSSCWNSIARWWRSHAMRSMLCGPGAIDPLRTLADLGGRIHKELAQSGLCVQCRSWTYAELQRERQVVWDSVPKWFGIVSDTGASKDTEEE